MTNPQADELVEAIFSRLCAKYVQRADARQQSMGLQYTEAETHDLAVFIARQVQSHTAAAVAAERERAARVAEDFPPEVLHVYERPGSPPGNQVRSSTGRDIATAIRSQQP